MTWKDIIAEAERSGDWKARHTNVGKIAKDLDESIQAVELNDGHWRKIKEIVSLKEGYSVNRTQQKLIKANIDYHQKLFKEILEELW